MATPDQPDPAAPVPALGRAVVIVGDAWTLRIIRALFVGHRTFGALRTALGISDAVLSRRLADLVSADVLTHPDDDPRPGAREYRLTEPGKDLWRVMVTIWMWDRSWVGATHGDAQITLTHRGCGHATHPVLGCGACGAIGVHARDVTAHPDPDLLHRIRPTRSRRAAHSDGPADSSRVLGDHWATLVLACALMGDQRFQDFQDSLNISSTTLTNRLNDFTEAGILSRTAQRAGGRRQIYRLTPAGQDFFPVAAMLNDWSRTWLTDDGRTGLSLTHRACGTELHPQLTCNGCNAVLQRTEVRFQGTNLVGTHRL